MRFFKRHRARIVADFEGQLLGTLAREPLAGPTDLAKRLGVDRSRVRRALNAMFENGTLRGFSASPHAAVFQRTALSVGFDAGDIHATSLEAALTAPDVLWAATTMDGALYVYVAAQEREPAIAAVEAALDAPHKTVYRYPDPPNLTPLGPLDWRVMRALVDAPRASIATLATATGLGRKTITLRRRSLVSSGAIEIYPLFRTSTGPGPLHYHMNIHGRDERAIDAAIHASRGVVINRFHEPPAVFLFCTSKALTEQHETHRRVRQTPGITQADITLPAAYQPAGPRMLAWIDAQIAAWSDRQAGRARPAASDKL